MKHFISFLLCTLLGISLPGQSERPEKPNVLLMLVDDLGWQDLICYDVDEPAPYETPILISWLNEGCFSPMGIPHRRSAARVGVRS